MVEVVVPDRAIPLTIDHVNEAKEILIRRQDTHLDSLADNLKIYEATPHPLKLSLSIETAS
jgi:hypothetical protein